MTFAYVGPLQTPSETNPTSITTTTVGDFVLFQCCWQSTETCTGISGGNCTWTPLVSNAVIAELSGYGSVWLGEVTATGSAAVTLTFSSGTNPGYFVFAVDEFSCSSGLDGLSLDSYEVLSSSGTGTMPTLTPSGSGELAWGYAHTGTGEASPGSTPGVVYQIDGNGNGLYYDLDVSSPLTVVWGDVGHDFGVGVLVKGPSGVAPGAPPGAGRSEPPVTRWAVPPLRGRT